MVLFFTMFFAVDSTFTSMHQLKSNYFDLIISPNFNNMYKTKFVNLH